MSQFLLDHIIILVPPALLENIPASITDAFTITPGGTHADGLTYNRLIVLPSGVYLELIAFVPPREDETEQDKLKRRMHWWSPKFAKMQTAVIDWCLTSASVGDVKELENKTPGLYGQPQAGGRRRPDGEEVKWEVTFPAPERDRGSVPFFCHDTTPRDLRVPPHGVKHPSDAVGVRYILLTCAPEIFDDLITLYSSLFGHLLTELGPADSETRKVGWKIHGEPNDHLEGKKGKWWEDNLAVYLCTAVSEEDRSVVEANGGVAGVKEICLLTENKEWDGRLIEVKSEDGRGTIRIKFDELTEKSGRGYDL